MTETKPHEEPLRELIGPYLDDALPTEARRRVEAFLLRDKEAAWEAQSLRITRDRLRGEAGEVVASDAFRARVLHNLRADNPHLLPAAHSETASAADDPAQYALPIKVG